MGCHLEVLIQHFNVEFPAGNMATFKKPRRNFRGRKVVTEDDSDDDNDNDTQDMDVDDQTNGPELPKPVKKSKKNKTGMKTSLSFANDLADEGLLFQTII